MALIHICSTHTILYYIKGGGTGSGEFTISGHVRHSFVFIGKQWWHILWAPSTCPGGRVCSYRKKGVVLETFCLIFLLIKSLIGICVELNDMSTKRTNPTYILNHSVSPHPVTATHSTLLLPIDTLPKEANHGIEWKPIKIEIYSSVKIYELINIFIVFIYFIPGD